MVDQRCGPSTAPGAYELFAKLGFLVQLSSPPKGTYAATPSRSFEPPKSVTKPANGAASTLKRCEHFKHRS